jgi:hypothetical protein
MVRNSTRAYVIATSLGMGITCIDLFADNGELSPAAILLLFLIAGFLIAGGFTTALHPRLFFAPLLLTAAWLPAAHLVLHALGRKTTLQPDTVRSILMVGVVGLGATLIGGLVGAAVGRFNPPRTIHVERPCA